MAVTYHSGANWDWPAVQKALRPVVYAFPMYAPIGFMHTDKIPRFTGDEPYQPTNLFSVLLERKDAPLSERYRLGWVDASAFGYDSAFVLPDMHDECVESIVEGWIGEDKKAPEKEVYGAKCDRCEEFYEHALLVPGFRCYGCRMPSGGNRGR